MEELTVRAGLASPEIFEAGGCVTVRFSPTRYVPPQRVAQNVTARQQRVLAVLSESGAGLALRDVHEMLGQGITERQARKDLEALRILGLAQATGHGRGSRWRLS
jgi:ATP-dependent DNA helicase RecG